MGGMGSHERLEVELGMSTDCKRRRWRAVLRKGGWMPALLCVMCGIEGFAFSEGC